MDGQTTAQMVTLTIDGKAISVPKGTTVYHAAMQLGLEIPIFCYQDRMPPFGACRVCLVEVEKMAKLQTSCTLEATEGMVVKTQSAIAAEGRKEILEFLLINHPLDCPICDRGGECPLQENALRYGPGMSRFFEEKRHFKKPLPLGPVLMLDRERCIICARCTRFGETLAGDHALQFIERGYKTEVGTPDNAPADSKFIGNTIMICPVGALTSQVYRFRARPWDNQPTESSCTLCPVGCSMILDSRDGEIMRTRSNENPAVNDIWMCDKGWFGYEFTYHPDRLQTPLIRRNGKLETASWEEALNLVAEKMERAKPSGSLAAWGGNTLTFEENYLFQRLMREGCGVGNVDHRIGMPIFTLEQERMAPGMEMSIGECEELSFAVLLGLDLTEEFPVIWLRLRQAINRGAKVLFIGHFSPEIAPFLSQVVTHQPGQEVEFIQKTLPQFLNSVDLSHKGALLVGSQYLRSTDRSLILAELQKMKQGQMTLNLLEGRGNSMGARLAGMHPELMPLDQKSSSPGLNALEVLSRAADSGWEFLYVAGANPEIKYPSKIWDSARSKTNFLVVQDLFLTETAQQADVVLPTLTFIEKGGSFINIERRIQPLLPGKDIPENLYSDGEIFVRIAEKLKLTLSLDRRFSQLLQSGQRINALMEHRTSAPENNQPIRQSGNGEMRATFAHALFDRGVRVEHDPHVVQLVKKASIRLNPEDAKKRNIAEGSRIGIRSDGVSIDAVAHLDKAVAEGAVVLPLGFSKEIAVKELGVNLLNGIAVEIIGESKS
jgi:NADH-quinone oxidoreductase subunit G